MAICDESSSRQKLYAILAASPDAVVPSSVLTEELHSSRQAVFKLVNALRDEGIDIKSIPQKGYILNSLRAPESLSPTYINHRLASSSLFHTMLYFPEVGSTQKVLKKLAMQDAPQGIVVAADEQTEGRGRRGRVWHNAKGKNLMFSMLLRPELRPGEVQLLNLAAGIAVRNVLKNSYSVEAELKWPNDILVNGRKICGILSEAAGETDRIYYAVTGIGINVNTEIADMAEDIANIATSVKIETGKDASRTEMLLEILSEFSSLTENISAKDGTANLLSLYRKVCATIGKSVRVIQDDEEFCGTASGVTEQGALIVDIDGKEIIFAAADVHHLRLK